MTEILGKKWHTNFVNNFKIIPNRFYVRATWHDKNYFTEFKDYYEFAIFTKQLPKDKMSFYELIPANYPHRLYFDVDGEDVSLEQRAIDEIVAAIITVMKEYTNIDLDIYHDIVICNSSNQSKLSLHIVVCKNYVSDNIQAKEFYTLVCEKLSEPIRKIVDSKVYSRLQNFRLVGCSKENANRYKTISDFYYNGQIIRHQYSAGDNDITDPTYNYLRQLKDTIIGIADGALIKFPQKQIYSDIKESPSISKEILKKAIIMLNDYFKFDIKRHSSAITFTELKNNLIVLQRKKPSFCTICRRDHDHENPFAIIKVYHDKYKLFYSCRRAERSIELGELGKIEKTSESEVDVSRLDIKKTNVLEVSVNSCPRPLEYLLKSKPLGDICGL